MALSLHNSTVRKTINDNNETIKFSLQSREKERVSGII